jgi:hypothetical protein
MLELAEKHKFNFDTAQMPLNVMDAHFRSFAKEVVPVLVKKQLSVLGMKSMGKRFHFEKQYSDADGDHRHR